jgi:rRNA maturation endonuclease Nob1
MKKRQIRKGYRFLRKDKRIRNPLVETTNRRESENKTDPMKHCFSCGKELLEGNFELCPFCGNSSKS